MRFESGARLGPYEIQEPLGAGGMGEVYRAIDTRLDRSVAIKVLPSEFSANEAIRARFEREAKTISNLTHPNICTLHDVGREGETEYLVMEYLEGSSLAQRLEKGPLPLDEAIRYGIQIADALDRAHRSGVVHRDLKPGNVMITSSGAKLLDFGLAKASAIGEAPADGLTNLPTEQKNLTEEGTILGTFQYMAPEQLEGREADTRTDIFAFGGLLYEMITGQHAFSGKSRVSLIASIMEHDPQPITAHQPLSPPALDRLIRQCLKKDPDDRWQTAHDLSLQLRWIEEGGSQAGIPAPVVARRKLRERASWVVAALSGIVAIAFAAMWYRTISTPAPVIRTSVLPADDGAYERWAGIALSPDGSRLVYVGGDEDRRQLWVRELERAEPEPLRGTEGAFYPFWSSDGRDIGFFADGKLKRVAVSGGGARTLAPVSAARGGTWSDDGWIAYAPSANGELMRIPASGGEAVAITSREGDAGIISHRWPWYLPGGKRLLYLAQAAEGGTSDDASMIRVLDLETNETKDLVNANSSVQYSPSGHVLYSSQGSVLAQQFDPDTLEIAKTVIPIDEGVLYTSNEYAAFSQALNGHLLVQKGSAMGSLSELAWIEIDGTRSATIRNPGQFKDPTLSPDDRRLAVEEDGDIWVIDLERGSAARITFEQWNESAPVWSDDGEWIYFSSVAGNEPTIRRKRSSGVGDEEVLVKRPTRSFPADVSPDGGKLVIFEDSSDGGFQILVVDLETLEVSPVVTSPFTNVAPRFGPSSDWIAYMSNETGRTEVYAQKISGSGGRWQISTKGGTRATWSRNGDVIYFLLEGSIYAVDVEAEDSLEAGIPRKVFDVAYRGGNQVPYDVTSDGKRFVFVMGGEAGVEDEPMTLIQNWTRLLER